jgi:transcription initiation factor TFIIB
MRGSFSSTIICTSCSSSQAAITDPDSGEIICSNCGIVISDKIEDTVHPERRPYTFEEADGRARIGGQTSLARHDRGLPTLIGRPDKDASGQKIDNLHVLSLKD